MMRIIVFYTSNVGYPKINDAFQNIGEAVNWCVDERAAHRLTEWQVAGMELPGTISHDGIYETRALPIAQSPNWHKHIDPPEN